MRLRNLVPPALLRTAVICLMVLGVSGVATAGTSKILGLTSLNSLLGNLLSPLAGDQGAPQPGSVAYVLRDAKNIADAYGRQTAPDGQLSITYIEAAAQVLGTEWAAQLLAQAATPTRLALSPGALVPGWNAGNPYRSTWAGKRGIQIPVTYTNRYGALIRGDV
ncbi:MAG: hypothetical protein PHY31_06070, partial [Smithellaceae bacterium]|nr:hypothetical protein [Smithellaceae bacterium]